VTFVRRAAGVAACLVAIVALVGACSSSHGSSSEHPAAVQTTAAPSTPAPVVVAAAPVPAVPHDDVAAGAPSTFRIAGPNLDTSADVCGMPYVRPLDPPGDQYHTVCWVQSDFGVAPGSASGGTSYILGHAWAEAPLVFNDMSEIAMAQAANEPASTLDGIPIYPVDALNGDTITLQVDAGTLTYTVRDAYAVAKEDAGNVSSLMANTPDRVVLITCGVYQGVDIDQNVIVEAFLTSSVAA
jgi:hypothetical protein